LNIKIITTHGGIVGQDGSTHNALEDFSLMSSLPNLTVMVPADNIELKELLEYVFETEGPFYIRLPRDSFPKIHSNYYKFNIGKPDILKEGKDICLIGTGYGSVLAFESVGKIEKELNLSIKIVNLPTIKPIDEKSLLNEIYYFDDIIVLEEHNIYCGFGSIIARIISKQYAKIIKILGINNVFVQSGKRETILNKYRLNKQELIKYIKKIII
jgi:transketolase